jgi:hypothetical protein
MKAYFNRIASLIALSLVFGPTPLFAQEIPAQVIPGQDMPTEETVKPDEYHPVNFNMQVKNMHLWRGFKVTQAAMTGVDVHYLSRDGKFSAGIWGGAGFNGDYKEFDYYFSYTFGNFNLAVWDINNFSGRDSVRIFDYNPTTTSHFIDVTLSYAFPSLPRLNASWSTIIAGRDIYETEDGSSKNAYSNYVALDYLIYKGEVVNLHLFAGAGFAFGREQHFYGEKPNLVNLGLKAEKDIVIGGYRFPVSATGMWNPEQNYGALQVAVNLF